MKREQRVADAQETVHILEQGYYQLPGGGRVDLKSQMQAATRGTRLYDLERTETIAEQGKAFRTEITVTDETTYAAIARLHAVGLARLGCLNFASAKNAGGGFHNGAQAQEEALARSSGLYPSLLTQREYYERNRAHPFTLYLDLAIYSPSVPFIKDDEGHLLNEPVYADIVTAPAPNAGAIRRNEPHRWDLVLPTLARRAEMVLRIFALNEVRNLVLGAWGCGVFQNSADEVAQVFAGLLEERGQYEGVFERVVFAVFDTSAHRKNYAAFKNTFMTPPFVV